MRARDCIVVMAKQPIPGQAKSRLGAFLGDDAAAELYEAFLLDALAVCRAVDATALVSYAPDDAEARAYFARVAPGVIVAPQRDVPFGDRLSDAMSAAFGRGSSRVAVVGSDIPHLQQSWITEAFDALDHHDMALGPTLDGGYYVLSLAAPEPRLFTDIDWSSGRELTQTIMRAGAIGLRVKSLSRTFDVDDADDLRMLRDLIEETPDAIGQHTRAALARLDEHTAVAVAGKDR